jgi:SAM-dependent methyltransferase
MFNSLYSKYWKFGFKSQLYDILAPEEYYMSLQRVADHLEIKNNSWLLDAGCGSGLFANLIKEKLLNGLNYVGTDYLLDGLMALNRKGDFLPGKPNIRCFQSDLTVDIPLRENLFDAVVAHFCIYTMGNAKKRRFAIKNLRTSMKQDGTLIIVNPSCNYDPQKIIRSSIENLNGKQSYLGFMATKWLLYPLTLNFGLKYIDSQLKQDKWHAYTKDEFCNEISDAGFEINKFENVYADSAYLAVCKPIIT